MLPGLALTPNIMVQLQQLGFSGQNTGPCFLQGLLDVLGAGLPAAGHPSAVAALPIGAAPSGRADCPGTEENVEVFPARAAASVRVSLEAESMSGMGNAYPAEAPLPAAFDPPPGPVWFRTPAGRCAHAGLGVPAFVFQETQVPGESGDGGSEPVEKLKHALHDVDVPDLAPLPVNSNPPHSDALAGAPDGSMSPPSAGWDVGFEAMADAGVAELRLDQLLAAAGAEAPAGLKNGPEETLPAGNPVVEQLATGVPFGSPGEPRMLPPSLRGQLATVRNVVQVPSKAVARSPALTPLSAVDPSRDSGLVLSLPEIPPENVPDETAVVKSPVTGRQGFETGDGKNPVAPGPGMSGPTIIPPKSPALSLLGAADADSPAGAERPNDGDRQNAGTIILRGADISDGTRSGDLRRNGAEFPLTAGRDIQNTGNRGQAAILGTRLEEPVQDGGVDRPGVPVFTATVNTLDAPVKAVFKAVVPDGAPDVQTFGSQLAEKVAEAIKKARWLPDGKAVLEIRLDPPHLGSVRVKIVYSSAQDVDVKFFAADHGVREAVQQALPLLRDNLMRFDIHLSGGDVYLGADGEHQGTPADGVLVRRVTDTPAAEALSEGAGEHLSGMRPGINLLA
ncbi:MAG: flagellar hook-length control protein FliK [Bacillota bacterium]